MTKYFYPLILKNKRFRPFELSKEISIRRMRDGERVEFFGLKKAEFVFAYNSPLGHIALRKTVSAKNKGRYPHDQLFRRGIFDGSSDMLAANYVLCIDCETSPDDLIDCINLAFILYKPTSTTAYLGFREHESDVHFHYRMLIHGPFDYLSVSKKDLEGIRNIFTLIKTNNADAKFSLYYDLYTRALQGGKLEFDLRFLLLAICWESLYFSSQQTELQFRLCIRTAKLLSKHNFDSAQAIYKKTKDIYKTRCALVHSGHRSKINRDMFYYLTEIVRVSLNLYLKNKLLYDDDALEDMALK